LIYSTIAIAVTIESVGNYWFVIVGCFGVLGISYLISTLLGFLIPIANPRDFAALRIAATFPNIVALPILIFPSLCEFPVVHEGYIPHDKDDEDINSQLLIRECVAQANTMIFCYFFSWSLAFWSLGHRQLLQAAKRRSQDSAESKKAKKDDAAGKESSNEDLDVSATKPPEELPPILKSAGLTQQDEPTQPGNATQQQDTLSEERCRTQHEDYEHEEEERHSVLKSIWHAIKQTMTSPGFIAMALAFVTACIPPLQGALFEGGGPLRFLGSALETLGMASSPISTMVVAASLVPPILHDAHTEENQEEDDAPIIDENPAMTDPNFGPYQRRRQRRSSRFQGLRRSLRSGSIRMLQAVPTSTPEMRRLHIWFCLSRLFLTPAVVVGLIVAMDCGGGLLDQVPNLAKLVIIINSALPGALIVVVILKSDEELAETASAVAKVYLPSYLISIVTIAAWTSIGLWITLPDEDGLTVCQRI
jgi:predicted permease